MRSIATFRWMLTLCFGLMAARSARAADWKLFHNDLPECTVESSRESGTVTPGLKVTYSKPHNYMDNPAWAAENSLEPPLDLSRATRFTCTIQTSAKTGYYSGRWYLRLTDERGGVVDYLLCKEAWRAREPLFVEQALVGLPPKFDAAHVVKLSVLGYVGVLAQRAQLWVRELRFDSEPVGEADRRRAARWDDMRGGAGDAHSFLAHPLTTGVLLTRDGWDSGWTHAEAAPIMLDSGRGGDDDRQIAILPLGSSTQPIRVSMEMLRGPGGATISGAQARFFREVWTPTLPENRPDRYEGWYPDPLVPLEGDAAPVDPAMLTALWIDVHVPADARPGRYQGAVALSRDGVVRRLPVELIVHDFTLPERPTLRTSFWLFLDKIATDRGIKPEVLKFADYKPYVDMALEHRITPISTNYQNFEIRLAGNGGYQIDQSRWQEYYTYVMEHGGNAVHLGNWQWFGDYLYIPPKTHGFPGEMPEDQRKDTPNTVQPHRLQILKTFLDQEYAFLDSKGWSKYAYLQLYDEAAGAVDVLNTGYSAVAQVSPRTRILQTMAPIGKYKRYVGISVPRIPAVDDPAHGWGRDYVRGTEAEGMEPWFYSCSSFGITIPEQPVRNRMIPLFAFNSGAKGYLFWSLNYSTRQNGFPDKPWPGYRSENGVSPLMGDGVLIYPAGTAGGAPMPSLRLKLIRDGMEDYEVLNRLRELFDKRQARLSASDRRDIQRLLTLDDLLVAAWDNPTLVEERRRQAGEWIDKLTEQDVAQQTRH